MGKVMLRSYQLVLWFNVVDNMFTGKVVFIVIEVVLSRIEVILTRLGEVVLRTVDLLLNCAEW